MRLYFLKMFKNVFLVGFFVVDDRDDIMSKDNRYYDKLNKVVYGNIID